MNPHSDGTGSAEKNVAADGGVAVDSGGRAVVFFDGDCHLCNRAVQFVLARDPRARFRFAALESPAGRQLLAKVAFPADGAGSLLLLEEGKLYSRSTAALRIARKLRGLWPLLYVFILVPKPWRDQVYDAVAKRRYRWFGRAEHCLLPDRKTSDRFL